LELTHYTVSVYILNGSASKSVVIEITSNRQRVEKAAEFCENICCGDIDRDTDCLCRTNLAFSMVWEKFEIVWSTDFEADPLLMFDDTHC
jgi:hypothetical protein